MQKRAAALAKCRHFRALKIDLAIKRHENPHGLQLLISSGECEALVHEFIGKIFNGVGKNLDRRAQPAG